MVRWWKKRQKDMKEYSIASVIDLFFFSAGTRQVCCPPGNIACIKLPSLIIRPNEMQLQLDSSMLTRRSCRHYTVVQKVHELFSPICDLALLILQKWKASHIWSFVFLRIWLCTFLQGSIIRVCLMIQNQHVGIGGWPRLSVGGKGNAEA